MAIYIKNQQRTIGLNLKRLEKDLSKALSHLDLRTAELSILFVNSRRMRLLNTRYRGIRKDTDVLSFPLMDGVLRHDPVLLGDIVVSAPRAFHQAEEFAVPFYDELLRLLIHGLLHLIGYDHEANAYEKQKMEKKEREVLGAIKKVA